MPGPRFRPILFYALSVAFGKGLSLVTLPVVTRGLSPAEFVRLDMAASLLEPIGLIAAFALGEALFRFGQGDAEARRQALERLLGLGAMVALPLLVLTQAVLVPMLAGAPNLPGETALRAILAAACLGGLIELPLAYARLSDRSGRFLLFVSARSIGQAGLTLAAIGAGYGVDGVLIANAVLDGLIVLALLVTLPRGIRPRIGIETAGLVRYAGPILVGGFAMFVLGSCDRWFLAGRVEPETLASYALAAKLALALALAAQPFALWWYPRRLAVLNGPDGSATTARFWLAGIAILCAAAVAAMLAARGLVLHLFPVAYHGALTWLPPLLLIAVLAEAASLSNGPSYARDSGWRVLAINLAGAGTTLALYLWWIPLMGVTGALLATLAGQAIRLVAFLADRHRGLRLPYPLLPAIGLVVPTCLAVATLADPVPDAGLMVRAFGLALPAGGAVLALCGAGRAVAGMAR